MARKKTELKPFTSFLYQLDGLIDSDYVHIETDSKEVLKKIIELMD